MNNKELIEKYELELKDVQLKFGSSFKTKVYKELLDDLKQLDEPQKPVVPQFVADWIEYAKNEEGYNVVGAVTEAPEGRIGDWLILDNVNTFARAWLDGYEVEKEKRYLVKIRGFVECGDYFNYFVEAGHWAFSGSSNHPNVRTYHTRKELEVAGFGWVFDCEGIEVEEVEG